MKKINLIAFIFSLLSFTFYSNASIVPVVNTLDAGAGSLRWAISSATAGDTVLINVKGTITLNSAIEISDFDSLTIIGPYPKHNTITAGGAWTGALLEISNSGPIKMRGLGFKDGIGTTRHLKITDCNERMLIERCLFEGNNYTVSGDKGGSFIVDGSNVTFLGCSFINNRAEKGGAGEITGSSDVKLTNCTFSSNHATDGAGALHISNPAQVDIIYSTFVENSSVSGVQAIKSLGGTTVHIENLAIGNNGTGRQIQFLGTFLNWGGNRIRLNSLAEITYASIHVLDIISSFLNLGLRSEILEDGFGLKYWPITSSSSQLINPGVPTSRTPTEDCRLAPRTLKGSGTVAYPDAGAVEYTHLRVLNTSGNRLVPNSFLWTLEDAQKKDARHYIEFDIPGDPGDINFESQGVASDNSYFIDGFSQAGSSVPGPAEIDVPGLTKAIIEITFVNSSSLDHGIVFNAGSNSSTLQGIRVLSFFKHGIETNANSVSIWGNEAGISALGTELGNQRAGIRINSQDNVIGGWEHWMRNVVVGNGLSADAEKTNININSGDNNTIQGNIIGGTTNGLGEIAGATTLNGLLCNTSNNTIGGGRVNEGNIIVNNQNGIRIETGNENKISGNKIGIGYDGVTALGNSNAGILIAGSNDNVIGGLLNGYGNIIAHNGTGIDLGSDSPPSYRNSILRNSIFLNTGQGIDLTGDDDILSNDGTTGSGSNTEIDFPEINAVLSCVSTGEVTYTVHVAAGHTYRVEFFVTEASDEANGEGRTYVGSQNITPVSNPQTFTYTIPGVIPTGSILTATLTSADGNTSEFGVNAPIVAGGSSDFTFADFCPGTSGTPVISGSTGGSFSFEAPGPGDGATIDAASGTITGGVEGNSYSVVYSIADACASEDTVLVTVTTTDESFSFANFCPETTGTPTSIATAGGTFSLAPDLLDGATIDPASGFLSNGVEGTAYQIEYTVGTCAERDTVTATVIATDESFSFDPFCPGLVGTPAAIATAGGTFSFGPDPLDGASIDPETGIITNGVEGETYPVVYTVGVCAERDTVNTFVKTVTEGLTFDNFCAEAESPAPVSEGPIGIFSFGLPAPDDGATINASTGVINNPVEGHSYPVVQTVTEDGCTQSDTVEVSTIVVDESFDFPDICPDGTGFPAAIATPGGAFSLVAPPEDGVEIVMDSGELTGGVEGETYTVKYTVTSDGCADSTTVNVSILEVNEAFSFGSFCPGTESPAPVPEETGGIFSFLTAPVDGETIDPATGIISNPVEGNVYDIVYTYTEGACTQSDTVSVDALVVNEDFVFEDFCPASESPAPDPDEVGGTFTFGSPPIDGATIDLTSGVINAPTEGTTYVVVHSLTTSTCTETDTVLVTAIGINEAFTFANFCPAPESPAPVPEVTGGWFAFTDPLPVDGATINSVTGIITNPVEGTTYEVIYNLSDPDGICTETDTVEVNVILTDEQFEFDNFCAEFGGTPTGIVTSGGVFAFAPDPADGAVIDPVTGTITSAIADATYPVEYTVGICDAKDTVFVSALSSESAAFTLNDFCAGDEVSPDITGAPEGTFSFDPSPADGAVINPLSGIITNTNGGDYYVRYITPGSSITCSDTLIQMVTVHQLPTLDNLFSDQLVYCDTINLQPIEVIEHNLAEKVYWRIDSPTAAIADSGFTYTPPTLQLGENTYFAQPLSAEGCLGENVAFNYHLSDLSGMEAIEDFSVCLGSEARLEAYGGDSYLWETEVPLSDNTIENPTAFSLKPEIYIIHITNSDNCVVVDSVVVDFLPNAECEIEITNAFSPNNDGKNDYWYIEHLINYSPNTVYIYNRWGDEVLKLEQYDNINVFWDGTDKNGNPLPPNTYFYLVLTENQEQNQAGWVQLVR